MPLGVSYPLEKQFKKTILTQHVVCSIMHMYE